MNKITLMQLKGEGSNLIMIYIRYLEKIDDGCKIQNFVLYPVPSLL